MSDLLHKNDITKLSSEELIKLRKSVVRVLNRIDREMIKRVEALSKRK